MVRPNETEGMALNHALPQECEEMARILAWSCSEQKVNKDLDCRNSPIIGSAIGNTLYRLISMHRYLIG